MRRFLAMGLGLLMMASAGEALAQRGDEGSVAFVQGVYAAYSDDEDASPPLLGNDRVWSPRMAALILRDQELATDDLPYLDADPICNCQDWEHLSVRSVTVRLDRTRRRWVATVRFVNAGSETTTVLALEGSPTRGWKIDDVLNPGYPSLANQLAASIRRVEAGGSAHE